MRIDDRDLRELSQIKLRRHIGIVAPGAVSLREHDRGEHPVPDPRTDRRRHARPLSPAQADLFSRKRHPGGYATRVSHAAACSSPGRRAATARSREALLKDPAIGHPRQLSPPRALDVQRERAAPSREGAIGAPHARAAHHRHSSLHRLGTTSAPIAYRGTGGGRATAAEQEDLLGNAARIYGKPQTPGDSSGKRAPALPRATGFAGPAPPRLSRRRPPAPQNGRDQALSILWERMDP